MCSKLCKATLKWSSTIEWTWLLHRSCYKYSDSPTVKTAPFFYSISVYFSVPYRLFWYQVLTCVSVRLRAAARSMRSCTLRYFCRSKLLSSWLSWWSVKAVRALRGFFVRIGGLSLLLEISRSPSSLVPIEQGEGRSGLVMENHEIIPNISHFNDFNFFQVYFFCLLSNIN